MHNWTKTATASICVDILLFDRFSNHCLANALEPFRAANTLAKRQAYHWQIYTLDGSPVVSSSGISVVPGGALKELRADGMLFVISSYGYRDLDTPKTRRGLRAAAARSDVVVGMDTGAWLMAATGLLDGRRATIHWDLIDSFAERFLAVNVVKERFVADGNRITCGGATTAFEVVLDMIRRQQGEALRLDVAALFMHELAGVSVKRDGSPRSRLSARAMTLMQENIEHPLSVNRIAEILGCTQKQLERRCIAEFGAPPFRIYRHLRLAAARRLLENSDLPIAEVALRIGYANASAMTRAFRWEFGLAPRAMRKLGS